MRRFIAIRQGIDAAMRPGRAGTGGDITPFSRAAWLSRRLVPQLGLAPAIFGKTAAGGMHL